VTLIIAFCRFYPSEMSISEAAAGGGQSLLRRLALSLMVANCLFGAEFNWSLPRAFPSPSVPSDNPMSAAKVELGRYLFYEKRMSVNSKESCGSCHRHLSKAVNQPERSHHARRVIGKRCATRRRSRIGGDPCFNVGGDS
jgi:cytochrome c peroxidase